MPLDQNPPPPDEPPISAPLNDEGIIGLRADDFICGIAAFIPRIGASGFDPDESIAAIIAPEPIAANPPMGLVPIVALPLPRVGREELDAPVEPLEPTEPPDDTDAAEPLIPISLKNDPAAGTDPSEKPELEEPLLRIELVKADNA